mmetsp:Transcript_10235/g.24866  ORF Transcript_10235/g.24866 Transcript_10235/m.24866 type:complete len:89 (+) Transcript_10235:66-332(+)
MTGIPDPAQVGAAQKTKTLVTRETVPPPSQNLIATPSMGAAGSKMEIQRTVRSPPPSLSAMISKTNKRVKTPDAVLIGNETNASVDGG